MITETELQDILSRFFKRPVRIKVIEIGSSPDVMGRVEIDVQYQNGSWRNAYTQTFSRGTGIDNVVRSLISYNFETMLMNMLEEEYKSK